MAIEVIVKDEQVAKTQAAQLVNQIVVLKSNPHYRVADVVYNRGYRFLDSGQKVLALPEFEGTLLRRYLIGNGGVGNPTNLPLLCALTDAAIASGRFKQPEPGVLAVHLRAGDHVEHDFFLTRDFIGGIKQFSEISKCHFVTCFAFQEFAERQWWMFTEEKLQKYHDDDCAYQQDHSGVSQYRIRRRLPRRCRSGLHLHGGS